MNTCHAYGCHTLIHKGGLLCQRHWSVVPKAEKSAFERSQHAPQSAGHQLARRSVLQAVARARITPQSTLNPAV